MKWLDNYINDRVDARYKQREDTLRQHIKDVVIDQQKETIEFAAHYVIEDLFTIERLSTYKFHWATNAPTLRGEILKAVTTGLAKETAARIKDSANDLVNGEAFLDSIVARIQNKQL